ncbi:hypothetical protein GJ496_011650 [Pomphorhynchus laevis]|nr:hypothetical protein GJ496_011650 [Pomphorhynchus laevis]
MQRGGNTSSSKRERNNQKYSRSSFSSSSSTSPTRPQFSKSQSDLLPSSWSDSLQVKCNELKGGGSNSAFDNKNPKLYREGGDECPKNRCFNLAEDEESRSDRRNERDGRLNYSQSGQPIDRGHYEQLTKQKRHSSNDRLVSPRRDRCRNSRSGNDYDEDCSDDAGNCVDHHRKRLVCSVDRRRRNSSGSRDRSSSRHRNRRRHHRNRQHYDTDRNHNDIGSSRRHRQRSRSRSVDRYKLKEETMQKLMQLSSDGHLDLTKIPLSDIMKTIVVPREYRHNQQQAMKYQMSQLTQRIEQLTGVKIPSFYCTGAVNPLVYAEQMRKRKLLWSGKNNESTSTAKVGLAMTEGIRDQASLQNQQQDSNEIIQRQAETFQAFDREYELARLATHTHRGTGLGFLSAPSLPVSNYVDPNNNNTSGHNSIRSSNVYTNSSSNVNCRPGGIYHTSGKSNTVQSKSSKNAFNYRLTTKD